MHQLRLVRFQRERELRQIDRERLVRRRRRMSVRHAFGRSMIRLGHRLAADPDHPRARSA